MSLKSYQIFKIIPAVQKIVLFKDFPVLIFGRIFQQVFAACLEEEYN